MWSAFRNRLPKLRSLHRRFSNANTIATLGVAGAVLLLRTMGLLQGAEWTLSDIFLRLRPDTPLDDRLLVVGIDEIDIEQLESWPLTDAVLAETLTRIAEHEPAAIGLDLYRNFPVGEGRDRLVEVFKNQPNLIGIEKLSGGSGENRVDGVAPPPTLRDRDAVGFNNTLIDSDGIVRRSYLYLKDEAGRTHESFALKLALEYLEAWDIGTKTAPSGDMQLGEVVFPRFSPNDGPYVRADARGYQYLANYRSPITNIESVTLRELLAGEVEPEQIRDRVVLIGSTASSIRDRFVTPYNRSLLQAQNEEPGVYLQAEFVGQILDGALSGRPFWRVWSEAGETVWIFGWAWVGAIVSWRLRSVRRSFLALTGALVGLGVLGFCAYVGDWWLPTVPAMVAVSGSTVAIVSYLAYLGEEFRRSKDFLQSIIDTIPDPIFVKDTQCRPVVLNEAYGNLVGYPLATLLSQTEDEIFPEAEAQAFRDADERVLTTGEDCEMEETLTDAQGNVHVLATKRSLHRDGAGNRFLIGAIRDITERKRMEEQLRQIAADLAQSNAELKQDANHDQLTGLPNRKLFQERLQQAIDWARDSEKQVGVMFLDLDGFKEVNDSLGHATGDLLLQAVAKRLSGSLRGSDTVARLGGDEFTVILPGIPTLADATRVAQKLVGALSQPFELEVATVSVTTSIGIGLYPVHSDNLEDLICLADEAMFRAKRQGKNRYCVVTDVMESATLDSVKQAIARDRAEANGQTNPEAMSSDSSS